MPMTRRRLLQTGTAVGGAVAFGFAPWQQAQAAAGLAAPQGTTAARTLQRGAAGAGGYTRLVEGAGEPHVVRSDLRAPVSSARTSTRTPLLSFAHLTDVHIVDAQSPARVEYVDRLDDSYGSGDITLNGLLTSSYRAHEMLTTQVADAMVQAVNRVGRGPVTGKRLAFAIQTGDNSDNCQYNEVRWNIDLLAGKKVTPDSGSRLAWEGVHDRAQWDPHYWHPDGKGLLQSKDDLYTSRFGFPRVSGLLDAARRSFTPQGLTIPWFSVFGNHDGLVQGNFPHTLPLSILGTGPLKIQTLPPGLSQADVLTSLKTADLGSLLDATALGSSVRLVTPDGDRRSLTRQQVVEEHFTTQGSPVGHGFTQANRTQGTAYYTFDSGPVRGIVLDSVNPNGYADGSLDATQFAWLQQVLAASTDRYVMVFSHHTSSTMTNPLVATGADLDQRVLGTKVVDLLLAHPHVVAWVNGHTHRNQITPHAAASGTSGFWEINTASHVDFPQQSRLVELVDNRDGTISLFTTMLDHAGPTSHGGSLGSTLALAALARELAANDPQLRTGGLSGAAQDRNTELLLTNPLG